MAHLSGYLHHFVKSLGRISLRISHKKVVDFWTEMFLFNRKCHKFVMAMDQISTTHETCIILYFIVLFYIILCLILSYNIILYFISLYYSLLYSIILCYILLYYIILYVYIYLLLYIYTHLFLYYIYLATHSQGDTTHSKRP